MVLAHYRRAISASLMLLAVVGTPVLAQQHGPVLNTQSAVVPADPTPSAAPTLEGSEQEMVSQPAGWWQGHWSRFKHHLQECAVGFPEEFAAPPLGASVYAPLTIQLENATAARMVLYHYDFVDGTAQLNYRGRDQLRKIATLMPENFCPIIIERTPCAPELDESRRLMVFNELAQCAFPVPPERIVVGPPLAIDMPGEEAEILNRVLLLQSQTGASGGGGSSGGGAGGGFGASGGGASPR